MRRTCSGASTPRSTGRPYGRPEPRAGVETADSLNNRAASLLDLGREKEAEELLGHALQLSPQHLESTTNRMRLEWGRAGLRDDEIRARIEEASKSQPATARAAHLKGRVLLALGDFEGSGPGAPGGRGGGNARRRPPRRSRGRGMRARPRHERRRRLDAGGPGFRPSDGGRRGRSRAARGLRARAPAHGQGGRRAEVLRSRRPEARGSPRLPRHRDRALPPGPRGAGRSVPVPASPSPRSASPRTASSRWWEARPARSASSTSRRAPCSTMRWGSPRACACSP